MLGADGSSASRCGVHGRERGGRKQGGRLGRRGRAEGRNYDSHKAARARPTGGDQ